MRSFITGLPNCLHTLAKVQEVWYDENHSIVNTEPLDTSWLFADERNMLFLWKGQYYTFRVDEENDVATFMLERCDFETRTLEIICHSAFAAVNAAKLHMLGTFEVSLED